MQDFNKSLSYAQPKGAYCSFLGTFENLNKPYSAEFGLPYVVLASTTASSNWIIYHGHPSGDNLALRASMKSIGNLRQMLLLNAYFVFTTNNKQDLVSMRSQAAQAARAAYVFQISNLLRFALRVTRYKLAC